MSEIRKPNEADSQWIKFLNALYTKISTGYHKIISQYFNSYIRIYYNYKWDHCRQLEINRKAHP